MITDTRVFKVDNGEDWDDIDPLFILDVTDLFPEAADELAEDIATRLANAHQRQVRWNRRDQAGDSLQGHYCSPYVLA